MIPTKPEARDMHSRSHFLLPLALSVPLCSCITSSGRSSTTLRGEDHDVRSPALRASFNLRGGRPNPKSKTPEGVEYSVPLALDFEYSRAFAETRGRIEAGELIRFGGQDINGPTDYFTDADLDLASLVVRSGFLFTSGIAVEGYLGLGHTRFDLTVDTGTERISDRLSSVGPMFGARLSYWIVREFGLYADVNRRIGIPRDYDELEVDVAEVGLRWWFQAPLGIFAAWRWIEYDAEEDDSRDESDLAFDFEGPLFGLQLSF